MTFDSLENIMTARGNIQDGPVSAQRKLECFVPFQQCHAFELARAGFMDMQGWGPWSFSSEVAGDP
ncbi:MAG: hypothetical protein DMG05_06265 [Acidobacteria bacterium]|nr:MAG: hypothetical protein DMG05_06265 [Acidobacteriota bacterium]